MPGPSDKNAPPQSYVFDIDGLRANTIAVKFTLAFSVLAIMRLDSTISKAIGLGLLCLSFHAVMVVIVLRQNRVGVSKEGLLVAGRPVVWGSIRAVRYVSSVLFRGLAISDDGDRVHRLEASILERDEFRTAIRSQAPLDVANSLLR